MNVVVIQVCTTGCSVAEDDVFHLGARRMCMETGNLLAAMGTFVRPDRRTPWEFRELGVFEKVMDEELLGLPTVVEALRELSQFVGGDVVVAHRGPMQAVPVIREKCAQHGLATRHVRVLDSADMARRLLGERSSVTLKELAARFRIIPKGTRLTSSEMNLEVLSEIVQRLWPLLTLEDGPYPVRHGTGVLPAIVPS
jgi:DNA polymerase III alpha subunit (gram-positive type)